MTENKTFDKTAPEALGEGDEYLGCTFTGCDFSGKTVNAYFEECTFIACNLSLARIGCIMRGVRFSACKLTGTDFAELDRFSGTLSFDKSRLEYAVFSGIKTKRLHFEECCLAEANFDNADIAFSVFDRCDLGRASFYGANLEGTDFSTAYDFAIDPATCRLKRAVFSESGLRGLVAHLGIEIV